MVAPVLDYFLNTNGMPDGILCTTERFVVDTIKYLKQNRISVPGDILVAGGFFNSPWNALLDHPVPIVNQDFQLVAQTAIEFLMERLQGKESPPRTVLIEAEFLPPGSRING
jgi:DNA-binding LacI/PurR family transcriptional regulator